MRKFLKTRKYLLESKTIDQKIFVPNSIKGLVHGPNRIDKKDKNDEKNK